MSQIDREYTRAPFYGSRKLTARLNRQPEVQVNRKRIIRLMRKMGLQAVYPRRRTSIGNKQHKKYPYLLRGLDINRPNQVWCADITYVPMPRGFMYLVAVMDWYSRFVLSWQLSNKLDGAFCLDSQDEALRLTQPEILNIDQGAQLNAGNINGAMAAAQIHISMDGRGRVFVNILI
jgi:putative transposase